MQRGEVYRNERLVGIVSKENGEYQFIYDQGYLNDPLALPISVGLPLQDVGYTSPVLFPFFANMLAEGSAKTIQCKALRIDENDLFTRLLKTTMSNTIGSITIKEVGNNEDKL
jgi:serine/threonine-protein kinase HipA